MKIVIQRVSSAAVTVAGEKISAIKTGILILVGIAQGDDEKDINWTSFNEVLENLNDLVKTGKIRHIGLSNETPWGMMKFLEISKQKSLPRMMSIQNAYNLVNRVFDTANSEVAIRENCGLLAYSPIAGGRLSGKSIRSY